MEHNKTRQSGFYWVVYDEKLTVGEYSAEYCKWYLPEIEDFITNGELDKIYETLIPPPDIE
jgi:hypothetical protein